ncbi:MAG: hypothetical protein ACKO23_03640, partial [Gemmataceae bacterium]
FDGESAGEILMKHLTSQAEMSKVPAIWIPIIQRALSKNPAHRYGEMAVMIRDVENLRSSTPMAQPAPQAPRIARETPRVSRSVRETVVSDPIPDALPAITPRQQLLELSWAMFLAVAFAGLAIALWAALRQDSLRHHDWTRLSTPFFLTVAASWAILIPGKFWTERRGDSWTRRIVMMGLGGLVGLLACWLDGWSPGEHLLDTSSTEASLNSAAILPFPHTIADEATYVCYYALAFFLLRWWRMTSRSRPQRFSFSPILGAGFWGAVLLLLIRPPYQPWTGMSALVLVIAAAIVQLASPWEPRLPVPAKKIRLRYA